MTVFFVVEPVLVLLRFGFFSSVVFTYKSKHLEKFVHHLMLTAAVVFLLLALPAQKHQSRDSGIQSALSLAAMGWNSFKHFLNIFVFCLKNALRNVSCPRRHVWPHRETDEMGRETISTGAWMRWLSHCINCSTAFEFALAIGPGYSRVDQFEPLN